MGLEQKLAENPLILTEGAVIERVRRETRTPLDPLVLHAGFIYGAQTATLLEAIYRSYLDAGQRLSLPIMVFTPTWRANPERLEAAGFTDPSAVNTDGVEFVRNIADSYGEYAGSVLVGGLMACKGDAYRPDEALSPEAAASFHEVQIDALCRGGADFIKAATLPALGEAVGLAQALGAAGLPYCLGFVLRPDGTLLDGTSLPEAISRVDDRAAPVPSGYMLDCTHPDNAEAAILSLGPEWTPIQHRVIGIQANGSDLQPEELDNSAHLVADDPETLARAAVRLHTRYGFRVLGGCCGTDERHIEEIGRLAMGAEANSADPTDIKYSILNSQ
jgi:S-methylmethionine-dependent homocysteine/selenocysteine methylase